MHLIFLSDLQLFLSALLPFQPKIQSKRAQLQGKKKKITEMAIACPQAHTG